MEMLIVSEKYQQLTWFYLNQFGIITQHRADSTLQEYQCIELNTNIFTKYTQENTYTFLSKIYTVYLVEK